MNDDATMPEEETDETVVAPMGGDDMSDDSTSDPMDDGGNDEDDDMDDDMEDDPMAIGE